MRLEEKLRKCTYLLRVFFYQRAAAGRWASAVAPGAPAACPAPRSSTSWRMSFTGTGIYLISFKERHSRGSGRALVSAGSGSVVAWLGTAAGSGRFVFIFGGGGGLDARMLAEPRGD